MIGQENNISYSDSFHAEDIFISTIKSSIWFIGIAVYLFVLTTSKELTVMVKNYGIINFLDTTKYTKNTNDSFIQQVLIGKMVIYVPLIGVMVNNFHKPSARCCCFRDPI